MDRDREPENLPPAGSARRSEIRAVLSSVATAGFSARSNTGLSARFRSADGFRALPGTGRCLLARPHAEVDDEPEIEALAYKVLEPERLSFHLVSYEWCFGQLKDAALLTLEIQRRALARGMSLKDCSSYNVHVPARPTRLHRTRFPSRLSANVPGSPIASLPSISSRPWR